MKLVSRWPILALADVVAHTQYGTSARANDEGVGVPVLRMNNITYEGMLDLANLKHVELPPQDLKRYSVERGDILFNRTNSRELVGKVGVWNRDDSCAFAGYLIRFRLRRDLADPFFIAAWFNTADMKTLLRARAKPSINMSNISATEALRLPVVCPPIREQRRIAEVLDRAAALLTKRRAALAQLDILTQAIFVDLFGDPASNPRRWPVVPLADLCSIAGEYGAGVSSRDYDPSVPRYIRITDIRDDGRLAPQAVSPAGPMRDWQERVLSPGDILFARSGATVGKTYLHRKEHGTCVFAGYLVRFRPAPEKLSAEFLFGYTRTQAYRSWVSRKKRVVAQPNINAKQYGRELHVPVPPVTLQLEFARRAVAVEELRVAHLRSLAEIDALFGSLQHRAFRGEL